MNQAACEDAMEMSIVMLSQLKHNEWCLESGATAHMCEKKDCFLFIDSNCDGAVQTMGKNDRDIQTISAGSVVVDVSVKDVVKRVELCNVKCLPDVRNNLLSVVRITENGYKVVFEGDKGQVLKKDGMLVMNAEKRGRLYVVNTREGQIALCAKNPMNGSRNDINVSDI